MFMILLVQVFYYKYALVLIIINLSILLLSEIKRFLILVKKYALLN